MPYFLRYIAPRYKWCTVFLIGIGVILLSFIWPREDQASFKQLMGQGSYAWEAIQSSQDYADLHLYQTLFEQNKDLLYRTSLETRIPKVIHFIWLGPKNFPEASKKNLRSWMEHHPDWKFLFWTDIDRECPIPGMEKKLTQEFPLYHLSQQYVDSSNFGEKSDLLRFEILYEFGGMYVDHDAFCFHSFEGLHSNFDFYVGLERPHLLDGFSSCIYPCIGILGSVPHHPIYERTIQIVLSEWEKLKYQQIKNAGSLIIQRTFKSFSRATRSLIGNTSYKDIALPASFFFAWDMFDDKRIQKLLKNQKVFLRHDWANSWEDELDLLISIRQENKKIKIKLKKVQKKSKLYKISLFIVGILFFQIGWCLSCRFKRQSSFLTR